MKIVPLNLKEANAFVQLHHRHCRSVVAHKFSIGLREGDALIGVSIASNPIARMLDDGKTLEIRRVCVLDGHPNACSKLLARMKRLGLLMGYERIITYTLEREPGTSLRAVGARRVAQARSADWRRRNGPTDHQPITDDRKYRWELTSAEDTERNHA